MLLPEATWFESEAMKRGVDPEVFFETWKQKSLESAAERLARVKAEVKPEKVAKKVARTLYGPGGKTKEVWIEEGQDFEPTKGWSLVKPEKPEKSDKTAEDRRRDNIRQYFSNQRQAEAQAAVTYQDKKRLASRMAEFYRMERAQAR